MWHMESHFFPHKICGKWKYFLLLLLMERYKALPTWNSSDFGHDFVEIFAKLLNCDNFHTVQVSYGESGSKFINISAKLWQKLDLGPMGINSWKHIMPRLELGNFISVFSIIICTNIVNVFRFLKNLPTWMQLPAWEDLWLDGLIIQPPWLPLQLLPLPLLLLLPLPLPLPLLLALGGGHYQNGQQHHLQHNKWVSLNQDFFLILCDYPLNNGLLFEQGKFGMEKIRNFMFHSNFMCKK